MSTLKYISAAGTELDLTNNAMFWLTGVDGMTSAQADITSTGLATMDGDIINNVKAQPRAVVLYLTTKQGQNVANVKRSVLNVIKHKQLGTLEWSQGDKDVQISGIVETIEMPRFQQQCILQISLYCSQPYWQDAEYIIQQIEYVINMHHFELIIPQDAGIVMGQYNLNMTRTFQNDGDAAIGVLIHIIATGNVTNPLIERADGIFFGVNVTMQAGDEIIISTEKGEKRVTLNGENAISNVKAGSTWFQLEVGDNTYTISEDGDTSNMYFVFEYKQRYV